MTDSALRHAPWETSTSTDITAPPTASWAITGGVSTVDHGQFRAVVATARTQPLTPPQLDAVRDVLARARLAGADLNLLDPTAPPNQRLMAFGQLVRPAIERGEVPGLTFADQDLLAALYDAAFGWGPRVQPLLDDPTVTEIKIIGTTVLAESYRGRIEIVDAYADPDEPGSRVRALAQLLGVTWDAEHPSVTLPLAHKTRLHATGVPLVTPENRLIVIRRGRTRPWTFDDLVERQSLSVEAAALLTGLVQAQTSVVVIGEQNAGKTALLECLLNSLPPHLHLVLVEDNTDEFCLSSRTVTRLLVNTGAADPSDAYQTVVRETLRMTPDRLVPGEIRGVEAAAIGRMAQAGRPTLTTIHAMTIRAGLLRFALLAASDVHDNPFAGQAATALRVIAESFQVAIQVRYSQRLNRRFVQTVALLGGVNGQGEPVLLPIIETVADGTDLRWICHATLVDGALCWAEGEDHTPDALAARLADLPTSSDALTLTVAASESIGDVFNQVREVLPYPDQAERISRLLDAAYRLDAQHRDLWTLAEQALAGNAAVQAMVATAVTSMTEQLLMALAARDVDTARAVVERAGVGVLIDVALRNNSGWQDARAAYETLLAQAADLERALGEVQRLLREAADLRGAYGLLQRFHAPDVPPVSAAQLLAARTALLDGLAREARTDEMAWIAQQRQIIERQQTLLAPSPPSSASVPAIPSADPSTDSSHPKERAVSVLAGDALPFAASWGQVMPQTACEHALVISNQRSADDFPEDPHPQSQDTATQPTVDLEEALLIRTDSAAEVGGGAWQEVLRTLRRSEGDHR